MHPSKKLLLLSSPDHTFRLWDLETGTCPHVFSGHREMVFSAVADHDWHRAYAVSKDGILRRWNLYSGICEKTYRGPKASVHAPCLKPINKCNILKTNHLSGNSSLFYPSKTHAAHELNMAFDKTSIIT